MRLLTPVLICIATFCSAQQFFKGHIVQKDDSKIEGLISYDPKKHQVRYKNAPHGEEVLYHADALNGFYIDKRAARFLTTTEKATGKPVFVELQYDGAISISRADALYVLRKDDSEIQMYLPMTKWTYETTAQFKQLKMREIIATGMMSEFLKDCQVERIPEKLKHITFSRIRSVVQEYNSCKNTQMKKLIKPSVRFGVIAGNQFPKMTPGGNYYDAYKLRSGVFWGVEVDGIPSSFHRRVNLNVGVIYSENTFEKTRQIFASAPDVWGYTSIRVPVSTKLFLRPGHSGLYFQPAVQLSFNKLNAGVNPKHFLLVNRTVYGFVGAGWEQPFVGHWVFATIRYETSMTDPYADVVNRHSNVMIAVGLKW